MRITVYDLDLPVAVFESGRQPRYVGPTGEAIRRILATDAFIFSPYTNELYFGPMRSRPDVDLYVDVVERLTPKGYKVVTEGEPQAPGPYPAGSIP